LISLPQKYAGKAKALSVNLNEPFSAILPQNYFDRCIALDVIEHLNDPDHFLAELFQIMKTGSYVYISTANIGYFPMRLLLALGQFNYGKRGILDKSHKRLFTVSNFKRSLQSYGFNIEKVIGFSPPFTDLISDSKIMCLVEKLHAFLSRLYPSLFAYNFLVIARRIDSIDDIFKKTIQPERDTLEA
jgi:SAM-dependent methyltransferase